MLVADTTSVRGQSVRVTVPKVWRDPQGISNGCEVRGRGVRVGS